MLLSLRKNGLTSLFKEVRVFKGLKCRTSRKNARAVRRKHREKQKKGQMSRRTKRGIHKRGIHEKAKFCTLALEPNRAIVNIHMLSIIAQGVRYLLDTFLSNKSDGRVFIRSWC